MPLSQEYEAWKRAQAPAATPAPAQGLATEYEAWKTNRAAAPAVPAQPAIQPKAQPEMTQTPTERALARGDYPAAAVTSLAEGVARSAGKPALTGFAKGLGAGAIETFATAYGMKPGADEFDQRAVNQLLSLARSIEGEAPEGGAERRAAAEQLQGVGAGKMVAGFAAAPVTIPLAATAAVLKGGELLRKLISQQAGWGETKAYAGEQWDLIAGLIPGYHAAADLVKTARDPSLSEEEKDAYFEDWMRTKSAGEIAGIVGATMATAKVTGRQRAAAYDYIKNRRAMREAQQAFEQQAVTEEMAATIYPVAEAMRAAGRAAPPAEGVTSRRLGQEYAQWKAAKTGEVPPAGVPPAPTEAPTPAAPTPTPIPTEAPAPAAAAPQVPTSRVVRGREGILKTPAGDYKFAYELVFGDEVVSSHNGVTFAKNPDYPEGVQERAYHRDPAESGKVVEHGMGYDPRFLITDNPDPVNGPPIVTSGRAVVLGGNSRHMTYQRVLAGLGRKGALDDYYAELLGNAERFGFTGQQVQEMLETGRPVAMVRRLLEVTDADPDVMREGVRRFNLDFKQALDPVSSAVSRARAMSPEGLTAIGEALARAGEDATLRESLKETGVESSIWKALVDDKIIPPSEVNKYLVPGTGRLNPQGVDMVEKVLEGSIIPDADLIAVAPKADVAKIVRSLPSLAQARSFSPEWDLSPALVEALRLNTRLRDTGLSARDFFEQESMFGELEVSERGKLLAAALREMKPTQFTAAMRQIAMDAARATDRQFGLGLVSEEPIKSPVESIRAATMVETPAGAVARYQPMDQPVESKVTRRSVVQWAKVGTPADTIRGMFDPVGMSGTDSYQLYGITDEPGKAASPERARHHGHILRKYMKKGERPGPGERQQFVALAGGWGSGKSTTRRKVYGDKRFVDADPDAIKEALPEYRANPDAPPELLAPFVHEESSWLAKAITFKALRGGLNTLYDSAGSGKTLIEMFKEAKARGAKTQFLYVEADPDVAFMSAQERARKSRRRRNTPADLYTSHRDAAAAALRYLEDPSVDEVVFTYRDPTQKDPITILTKRGGEVVVERPDLLKKIEEKSIMNVEERVHEDIQSGRINPDDGGVLLGGRAQAAAGSEDLGGRAGRAARAGPGRPAAAGAGGGAAAGGGRGPGVGGGGAPDGRGARAAGAGTDRPDVERGRGGVPRGARGASVAAGSRGLTQPFDPLKPGYEQPRPGTKAARDLKSRQEIITSLESKLKVPIRYGKLTRGAKTLGVFKVRSEVIRLRYAQDMSSAAHEVGHFVHKRLWGNTVPALIMDELGQLAMTVKPQTMGEGLAEFFRLYITNDELARTWKDTYAAVEEALTKQAPEIRQILINARDDLRRLREAPATAQMLAEISFDPKKERAITWHDLYTQTFDDQHPIRAVVDAMTGKRPLPASEDPYVVHRLLRGWRGRAEMFLQRGTIDFDNPLDPIGRSLKSILAPVWKQRKDFTAYVTARTSKEIYRRRREQQKKGEKTGIKPTIKEHPVPWSEELVDAVLRDQKNEAFEKAFDQLQQYQDDLLNYVKKAGGLSDEQVSRITKAVKDHVPMFRVVEGLEGRPYSIGSKPVNLFAPVKRLFGSTRPVIDPVESIYKNTLMLVNWAERNHAASMLMDFVEAHEGMGKYVERVPRSVRPIKVRVDEVLQKAGLGDMVGTGEAETISIFRPSLWEPEPNTVSVWKDGKPVAYRVHPELYRALMGLDREHSGFWFRFMRFPAATLRAGATLTYSFIMRNPVRDQFSAFTNTKYGYVPGVDFVRGLFHALRKDDAFWDYRASGAAYSELVSLDRAYLQGGLNQLMRSKMSETAHVLLNPLSLLQVASRVAEEATRIGELQKGLAKEGRTRKGATAAAYSARELTLDFQRLGAKMVALNHIAAFWNAGLQGLDRPVRAFKDAPLPYTARVMAGVTLPAVLLFMVNKDEDWYKDLPQWEKDMFYHFKAGGVIFRVPKPFELGILFASFPERVMRSVLEKDPAAFDEFLETALRALPNPLPTGALPIIENVTNHSFFFDRKVVPDRLKDVAPRFQYGPYTSEAAKRIGALTGTSPLKIENLVRGYAGGTGMAAMHGLDFPISGAEGIERPDKTWPEILAPGMVSKYPTFGAEPIERFYRGYQQSKEALTTTRELIKRGEVEQGRAYGQEHRPRARSAAMYQAMARNMSRLSQKAAAISADPKMDGATKRRLLDEIAARKTALARQFMQRAEQRGVAPQ